MRITNKMYKQTLKLQSVPEFMRTFVTSKIMGKTVPLVNTTGTRFEKITREEVIVSIKNKHKIQNHIKGVHACAMALIAETSTGFVTNMNCPDDKLILLKTMQINYLKIAKGNMKSVATLTDEMAEAIATKERGNFIVPVKITDETGESPVEAIMTWAWIPKKRKV